MDGRIRFPPAEALAASIALIAFAVTAWVRQWPPFGTTSRNTTDLGDQYVPIHGYLRDLLTGDASGDLIFNWQSGFGVPFLPDLASYLGNPISLLVLLFPRGELDTALVLITALKLATAAVCMAIYLRSVGDGPWLVRAGLAASYALCGWAINDAVYIPMWLDGLIFFPLFCLAAEWSIAARRFLPSVLIFGLGWLANFYTAYMATIAAGLILVARLLIVSDSRRAKVIAMGRFGLRSALGIGLVLPLLVPTFMAVSQGAPGYPFGGFRRLPVTDYLASVLPASALIGVVPAMYAGSAVVLLLFMMPLHTAMPMRTRIVWCALAAAMVISLVWAPTRMAWHGFDIPDGNANRQAFVLCGTFLIGAWMVVAAGPPGRNALILGTAALIAVTAVAQTGSLPTVWTWRLLSATVMVVLGALLVWRYRPDNRWLLGSAAVLAVIVLGTELTVNSVVAAVKRETDHPSLVAWGAEHDARLAAVATVRDFPSYRTDPGVPALIHNDPWLFGAQGAGYYSSLTPNSTFTTLRAAGYPTDVRVVLPSDNPVLDAIFSVGARVTVENGNVSTRRRAALPLVSFRSQPWREPAGDSTFDRQHNLLGAEVYEFPRWTQSNDEVKLRCERGGAVYLLAADSPVPQRVGIAAKDADFTFRITPGTTIGSSPHRLACLDEAALEATVQHMITAAPVVLSLGGHTFQADITVPADGLAVISVPWVKGWECSSDRVDFGGLMALPVKAGSNHLECRYVPPGLQLGTFGGAGAFAATGGIALLLWQRRRTTAADLLFTRG